MIEEIYSEASQTITKKIEREATEDVVGNTAKKPSFVAKKPTKKVGKDKFNDRAIPIGANDVDDIDAVSLNPQDQMITIKVEASDAPENSSSETEEDVEEDDLEELTEEPLKPREPEIPKIQLNPIPTEQLQSIPENLR